MMFIVILVALIIERFFDWSHLRQWGWFVIAQQKLLTKIPVKSPYLALILSIMPLLLVILLLQFLLLGVLYGFVQLIFQLIILLYCLGPRNFWADAFACIHALTQGDAQYAAEKLKACFGIHDIHSSQTLHQQFISHIFRASNHRVFAVIFWYVVLGPVGAVLYRTISLTALEAPKENALFAELSQRAQFITAILDWIPMHIFTFIFALSGHFAQVLACWRAKKSFNLANSEAMLTECGISALGYQENQLPEDGSTETAVMSLLDRSFIIALVLVALVTLLV